MDINRIADFIDQIDKAYEKFKEGVQEPLIENVTLMVTPEDLETLKSMFVDAIRFNQVQQNRDAIDAYNKLHANIFFQISAEYMF